MRKLFKASLEAAGHAASKLAIAGAILGLAATPANGQVGNEMNNFFNSAGNAANVTGPAAYQGQSAGYYSGGSVWARFPQKSINPLNIQLPRARGGCGGIDLFAGSFSFINTDEIVAMLKATANNALGFAFQLAIDSISAEIGGVIKDMSHKIQQINQFNMNSCEQAQALVGAVWPKMDGASSTICQQVGMGSGIFSDAARARHGCTNGGERTSTLANNTTGAGEILKSRNFTWHAMMSRPATAPDQEYAEFLMTLVGSIIWIQGTDENAPSGQFKFIPAASADLLTSLLDGTAASPARVLRCDTADALGCLNPTTQNLTIASNLAFKNRVRDMLNSINGKIRSNVALSPNEISLLGMTSIPLYKILTVFQAAQAGIAGSELSTISEAVAYDVLMMQVDRMLEEVQRNQSSYQGVAMEEFTAWRESVVGVRDALHQRAQRIQGNLNFTYQVIERTQQLELSLRNVMSPQMAASLRFGRGLSPQGIR